MNLSGKLPEGELNGLARIEAEMAADPTGKRVVLAIVDVAKLTTSVDTGEVIATARIRRVEPLMQQDLAQARRLLERAYEDRTGQQTLPYELEEAIEGAFGRAPHWWGRPWRGWVRRGKAGKGAVMVARLGSTPGHRTRRGLAWPARASWGQAWQGTTKETERCRR